MIASTNCSFALLLAGMGSIYLEIVWPGIYLPAILGVGAVATSSYWLAERSPSHSGVFLLAAAALLFSFEAFYPARRVAGLGATAALIGSVTRLFAGPDRLSLGLFIPLSVLFGAVTTWLAQAAQRARANKRADL